MSWAALKSAGTDYLGALQARPATFVQVVDEYDEEDLSAEEVENPLPTRARIHRKRVRDDQNRWVLTDARVAVIARADLSVDPTTADRLRIGSITYAITSVDDRAGAWSLELAAQGAPS